MSSVELARHVLFNPSSRTLDYDALDTILRKAGEEGWMLARIVSYNQWQAVAVFERACPKFHLEDVKAVEDPDFVLPWNAEHSDGEVDD